MTNKVNHKSLKTEELVKMIKESIISHLNEEVYSSMGGKTDENDINTFINFTNKYKELPGCSCINTSNISIDDVLMLYTDLLQKVSNAMDENNFKSASHWLVNCKNFIQKGDTDKANYSYKESYEIALEALNQKQMYLTESKETQACANKILRQLYKVSAQYKDLYKDDDWSAVHSMVGDMRKVNGVNDIYMGSGIYHNYLSTRHRADVPPYRTYKITIETVCGINIGGEITCCAAGTVEDPFYKYDIACSLWKE